MTSGGTVNDQQNITGILGERFAENYLRSEGFKICRADGDLHIGRTLVDDPSMKEFDCQNLYELTRACWSGVVCGIPNRPCKEPNSEFFQFAPLDLNAFNTNPYMGYRQFNHFCSTHLEFATRRNLCPSCEGKTCFIKSYVIISHYIRNYYYIITQHLGNLKRYKHRSIFWKGHPGRIDYFGFKDGEYSCIEVKTNSSRLSRWQVTRLNWMEQQGFRSLVARVSLKLQDIQSASSAVSEDSIDDYLERIEPRITLEEFQMSDYPEYNDDIPTNEELNYFSSDPIGWEKIKLRKKRQKP